MAQTDHSASCSRCGRTISIYSDEFMEWLWVEAYERDPDARPVCKDCLSTKESAGLAEDLRAMQEAERRFRA